MEKILELIFSGETAAAIAVVKKYIEQCKPAVYELGNEALAVLKDFANNKEYVKTIATFKKNQYDAYVDSGFSEEQAFALIINDNLKLLENEKRIQNRGK